MAKNFLKEWSDDSLGDRMKNYERRETDRRFMRTLPVYARIDGRSFTRFTSGLKRPYDLDLMYAMIETTKYLVDQTSADIGYTQSDEINLVWLAPTVHHDLIFASKVQKMVSVLAAMASSFFLNAIATSDSEQLRSRTSMLPHFDARVFQLPNREEAANMFLWREQDATKNAVGMAARAYYQHKQLDGKSSAEKQEMLFRAGVNFNDYPAEFKRGTFVRRESFSRVLTSDELALIPQQHRPVADQPYFRSEVRPLIMPPFGSVVNRAAVIFDGAEPILSNRMERNDGAA